MGGRSRKAFSLKQRMLNYKKGQHRALLKSPFICPKCAGKTLYINKKTNEAVCTKCGKWKFSQPKIAFEEVDLYCHFCDNIHNVATVSKVA
jgi:transcription elongation factor Elf1